MKDLAGVITMTLSLTIPIVAIIAGIIASIKKNNNAREVRRLIIENHTDLETARHLIKESEERKGSNPYPALRWGCVLMGLGVGALIDYLLQLEPSGKMTIYFWILIAFGCGLGLLASFVIEYRLQKRNRQGETDGRSMCESHAL